MSPVPTALVIPRIGLGGTPRHLLEVVGHVDRQRVAPVVYCLKAAPETAFHARIRALGVEIVDGRTAETFRRLNWVPAVVRLARLLRRRRIRVVQSYLLHANLVAVLAARLARVPVVVTSVRSLDAYTGHDRLIARLSNALADRVVVGGEVVRRHVHRAEGCPLDKLVVVANGVDLARVARPATTAWPAALAGVPVVGTVGRLAPKKAQADLLAAAPHVVDRVPAAHVVLLGDGPDRAALERQARALPVAGRVHFLGAVDDADALLARLDVFVLPSHVEGMSNALLEAMAAGRPVVATDVGASGELVVDGVTGFLVPPARPDRLAEAIVTLLKDPERARAMGAAGRTRVATAFTVERMVERLQALWDGLLRAREGGRG